MKNWSGHLEWLPNKIFYPSSEDEIVQIIQSASIQKKKVRCVGSLHSFTPISSTSDYIVSLDQYQGIINIDRDRMQVTVKSGTKLHKLNTLLAKNGLAMENMGDINVQSISGAISTGTHGTGTHFGNISTQVIKLQFINGLGEIVYCNRDQNPEIFKAAQISLGLIGVITEITLQCIPAFNLHLAVDKMSLEEVMQNYNAYNQSYRHFEYYWFPNTKWVMTKRIQVSEHVAQRSKFKDYLHDIVLENKLFQLTCDLSYFFPTLTKTISKLAANTISHYEKIDLSHRVFSTHRAVRFNEMEYNVPSISYPEVKMEIVEWINTHNSQVLFPIENRFVKQDDLFLSPAYQRDSAYIAVHVYHKKDFRTYFDALESIFKNHSGRPHWGKMHNLTFQELSELYPKLNKFLKIREELDPEHLFVTEYFASLMNIRT